MNKVIIICSVFFMGGTCFAEQTVTENRSTAVDGASFVITETVEVEMTLDRVDYLAQARKSKLRLIARRQEILARIAGQLKALDSDILKLREAAGEL